MDRTGLTVGWSWFQFNPINWPKKRLNRIESVEPTVRLANQTVQLFIIVFFNCQNDAILMFIPSSTFNSPLLQCEVVIAPSAPFPFAPQHQLWASPATTPSPLATGSCKFPSSHCDHPLCKPPLPSFSSLLPNPLQISPRVNLTLGNGNGRKVKFIFYVSYLMCYFLL